MNEPRHCPECGTKIPLSSPANLCPKCLLHEGLKSSSEASANPKATHSSPPAPSKGFVPPTPEELALRFPQLEILELLGKGGMGAVYKARQRGLDRLVAVKILPPEISRQPGFSERFTREARALARLNHPGIVAVYDSGQVDGLYYFVMEFIDGVNLRQAIQAAKLPAAKALTIVPQICEALQFAHNEGIIHRDIKPENVLLDKTGRVKIADFGVAKLLSQNPDETILTGEHDLMGTLRYMAPEQMDVSRDVDHRADIYSLGVVFYELLTGELPIGRFAPPSKKVQIDVRIDEIVLRALEQEPAQRYQHASEVKTDVEKLGQVFRTLVETPVNDRPFGATGSEQQADTVPRDNMPWSYWWKAIGLFLLAWLFAGAMWNFGSVGWLVSTVVMGVLFTILAIRQVQDTSRTAPGWNQLTPLKKGRNFGIAVVMAALGSHFLLNAVEVRWEATNWNFLGKSREEFAADFKGQEYKLIRQLGVFNEQVPTVELLSNGGMSRGGGHIGGNTGPHNGLFGWTSLSFSAFVGFVFFWASVFPMMLMSSNRKTGIPSHSMHAILTALRCSLALIAIPFFTGLIAYWALCVLQMQGRNKPVDWLDPAHFRLNLDPDRTMELVEEWAQRETYATGDKSIWELEAVPKGEKLGEVRQTQAWKPSQFDRWRMTLHGFVRVSPHLVVRTISSDRPVETIVMVYVGWPPEGPQIRQSWQSLLDRLEDEIKHSEAAFAPASERSEEPKM